MYKKDPSYQGGLIVNATRTPKSFKFDKADLYALAIDYDKFKKHLDYVKAQIKDGSGM